MTGRHLPAGCLCIMGCTVNGECPIHGHTVQCQDYSKRTHEQVVKDLVAAHSRVKILEGLINDAQDRVKFLLSDSNHKDVTILKLRQSVDRQKLMLWIQGAALTGCWGLVLRLMFR